MFLDYGRKLEYMEKTQAFTGITGKLHAESRDEPRDLNTGNFIN